MKPTLIGLQDGDYGYPSGASSWASVGLQHAAIVAGLSWLCLCISGCGGGGGGGGSTADIRRSIVFESNRDGDFEILRMKDDGSGVTRVTNNSTNDFESAFSRDGSEIVFVSNRASSNELFVVDANGTRQLTNNDFNDNQPNFSPDGSKVVFTSNRNGRSDLYLIDVATKVETQLTNTPAVEQDPTFAPDGKILYTSLTNGRSHIFQIDANGANPTLVSIDAASNQFLPTV